MNKYSPGAIRHDWTRAEVQALFELPFAALLYQAHGVHRDRFDPTEVQISTLLSVKTGGCAEDCSYCSQSSHHTTDVTPERSLTTGPSWNGDSSK